MWKALLRLQGSIKISRQIVVCSIKTARQNCDVSLVDVRKINQSTCE